MKSNKALSIMHAAIRDLIAIAIHAVFTWLIWWFITTPLTCGYLYSVVILLIWV